MRLSVFHNASAASVWQRQHLHAHEAKGCGLWGNRDKQRGHKKEKKKLSYLNKVMLLPKWSLYWLHTFVIHTYAQALPHLSLISECLNLVYSVERLPADTQHQIKSFTVESKEFSLSLDKHESNGGDVLSRMGASSDTPQWFHRGVVVYPSAFAFKFKCHLKPSKIMSFIPPMKTDTLHLFLTKLNFPFLLPVLLLKYIYTFCIYIYITLKFRRNIRLSFRIVHRLTIFLGYLHINNIYMLLLFKDWQDKWKGLFYCKLLRLIKIKKPERVVSLHMLNFHRVDGETHRPCVFWFGVSVWSGI